MSWILLKQFVFRKLQAKKLFSCKTFSWKAFVFKYLNYIKKVIILKNWIILIQHPISLFFGVFFFLLKADLCFQVCSYIKQVIACLILMGYDPVRESEWLALEIQEWNVEQKKLKNNTGFLKLFSPIVPVKLNFWALSCFGVKR